MNRSAEKTRILTETAAAVALASVLVMLKLIFPFLGIYYNDCRGLTDCRDRMFSWAEVVAGGFGSDHAGRHNDRRPGNRSDNGGICSGLRDDAGRGIPQKMDVQ